MDPTEQKNQAVLGAIRRATGGRAPAGKRRESVEARDVRLLKQSARALRQVSEWLNECEQCGVDLHDSDDLGVIIAAVDEALDEAEEARDHIRNAR